MHTITIHNKSNHTQEFEVHGYNGNKNIKVGSNASVVLQAPDHTSGAIIALHDGHEGEQAEITKDAWQGNDTIDISNIVGTGGDLTVQQVNDPSTRKGNPVFMKQANEQWAKTPQNERDQIKSHVFLDKNNRVVRLGAPHDIEAFEKWVRKFDEGKSYIGPGAWDGKAGDAGDNAQSSAAHGNKDILVTYADNDATPEAAPQPQVKVRSVEHSVEHKDATSAPAPTPAAAAVPIHHELMASKSRGPGVTVTNKSKKQCSYYFYDNLWNGNGTAGANFDHPMKSIVLAPGASAFVSLPASFKGRVQRGTQQPATWAEFQLDASNDHGAHGDISLEQGCDGAATIRSTDGSNREGGFTNDVLAGAPKDALRKKPDGEEAVASTAGNWLGGPNQAAIKWLNEKVGQKKAYIVGGTGTPDVASKNQELAVDFY